MTVTSIDDTIARIGFVAGSLQPVTVWNDEDFGLIASLKGEKLGYFITRETFANGDMHTDAGVIDIAWWKEINDTHNANCAHSHTHVEVFDQSESVFDYRYHYTVCSHCKKLLDTRTEVFGYDEEAN